MRLLGLELLDYRRLTTLRDVADELSPSEPRGEAVDDAGWRWFTGADVTRIAVIVGVCGGRDAYATSEGKRRRLRRLDDVRKAGKALQENYGTNDPLLDVMWVRQGTEILVVHQGLLLNPVTNQVVVSLGLPTPGFLGEVVAACGPALASTLLQPLRYRIGA